MNNIIFTYRTYTINNFNFTIFRTIEMNRSTNINDNSISKGEINPNFNDLCGENEDYFDDQIAIKDETNTWRRNYFQYLQDNINTFNKTELKLD